MLQLLQFFSRNKTVLLFLFLELLAFVFIINTHSYQHSKYINSANAISGSILKKSNRIKNYFSLNKQNQQLIKENEFLKNKLSIKDNQQKETSGKDSLVKYRYIAAKVVSNPYRKRNNFLTIDKGAKDGVKPDMGVVLSHGIVGIVLNVSNHYATVLSILNAQSKINVKMKNSHHYGSLTWKGDDYTQLNLEDLPIQANIKKGDTIISGGKSVVFPEGIPIGVVSGFNIQNKSYENIDVQLFADMSALYNVYVIQNNDSEEQNQLEYRTLNE
jgi:rod shape-determining protein MreC